ncbi:MAG: glycine cleavage system protein GcvH [Opitutales bacterium]
MDEIPGGLRYTSDHEWITESNDAIATIGITYYAQNSLGDITFVELPEVGAVFEAAETFGVIESVKAASDLYMPLAAEVVAVNDTLESEPENINQSPYEAGWLIKVRIRDAHELASLLTAEAYAELV